MQTLVNKKEFKRVRGAVKANVQLLEGKRADFQEKKEVWSIPSMQAENTRSQG